MIAQTRAGLPTQRKPVVIAPPKRLLSGYEILNADALSRPVNIYRVEFSDPAEQTHENRGRAKQVIWDLRGQHQLSATVTVSSLTSTLGMAGNLDKDRLLDGLKRV